MRSCTVSSSVAEARMPGVALHLFSRRGYKSRGIKSEWVGINFGVMQYLPDNNDQGQRRAVGAQQGRLTKGSK